ncbi:MAG: acyl-CoA dehydrogenase family protein [Nitrososphaeria archaeon]|jgi:acyl-CoA dehydrogenase
MSLPEGYEEVRARAREFALREFTEDVSRRHDETEEYPDEVRRRAFSSGLLDMSDPWKVLIAMEEFCRVDPGLGLSAIASMFGSEILMLFGSDAQRERYLAPVMRGEMISAVAVTEPTGGSDVAGARSTMERVPGGYVLNGEKMFITNGTVADFYYVLARTSPPDSPEKRHRGLSVAIVERRWPGVTATKLRGKLGMRATDTAEVRFEGVRVPEENLVGEEGKGFYYIMTFFNISRVYVAAQAVGTAQGLLDLYSEYLSRRYGSRPPPEGAQFVLAEGITKVEAARLLTYRAASLIFQFRPDPALTSMAKYYAAEVANEVAQGVIAAMGEEGLRGRAEKLYRDAKITEIWEGTSEIEKLVIYRQLTRRSGS